MDPNAGYPAGFPVPTQSPNQMSFYPNSMQFPQSKPPPQPGQQQHSFGAIPMQPGAPGGAMMPSGFPQSSAAPMENFSAPFTQPPMPPNINQFPQPSQATNGPSTVAQTFAQNMASVNANNLLANQPKPAQINSPRVNPSNPGAQMNQGSQPAAPAPNPAQSQAHAQVQAQAVAREKARVTTLLDINSALLQEVVNLQGAGKAGPASNADANASSADQAADATKPPAQKPSPEYIECMRRLQANLAYLATIADRAKKSGAGAPQAPAIMTPPPNLPALHELYTKLNELFPRPNKASTPQKLSPATAIGNGGPSPSPASESAV
ncbi:uncharacterized protein N7459_000064 [Penicillium hispanicum]|uniref:uncharacterized protein n=1 Tax=Penicillium hispanicum TaxID=1080232 RepID=UPI002541A6C8|nr:uncharacterized protein N7459_000064 [Penicillium hispanicum]KAJ5593856.1 hypothetical protein N7459_000064 [Penicillium hispanicum]